MEIVIKTLIKTKESTISLCEIDGVKECYALEDAERIKKIWGKTRIPHGRYRVIWSYSPKFKKYMPELKNVPGFEGIRIHKGNWAKDTNGCILLGAGKSSNYISKSGITIERIYKKIKKELDEGKEVWITIK